MSEGPDLGIGGADLSQLFSIVMCVDESMNVVYASETLEKCLPEAAPGVALNDVFDCLRPSTLSAFSDGVASVGALCLLRAKSGKFAIRGQLVETCLGDVPVLCFCGAPWLFWINTNAPDTQLALNDFASQDVQLDHLFFMNSEKNMVADLETLNSDLKLAKQQLEKARDAQGRFFAQMSHEIRTPLNGLVSALALLEGRAVDPESAELLRLAQGSSDNLIEVVNYALEVSKLELSPELEKRLFRARDLVSSVADVVHARARHKALEIRTEIDAAVPAACQGSPDQLRQTLLNLLGNAIKFTDAGHITVRVRPAERPGDDHALEFEVEDTGIGIAQEDLENIFAPFWTSGSERAGTAEQGTGLGLDIVKRNVAGMGGDIDVRSEVGAGSCFSFRVPVEVSAGAIDEEVVKLDADKVALERLQGKVLLVDDNVTNLKLGAMILESLELDVATANGGLAAVEAVGAGDIDLVLMDISMPDIDGLEATRRIRKETHGKSVPIVALTAHIDAEEERRCVEAGMDGYLTKPIVRPALSRALAGWLSAGRAGGSKPEALSDDEGATLVEEGVVRELATQIGAENLCDVVDTVKEEAESRRNAMQLALQAGDDAAILHNAHSLVSILRSVGVTPLGDRFAAAERELRGGGQLAPDWLDQLAGVWRDSLQSLEQSVSKYR